MIYVNKIKNRITFKIKAGYYLELLTPEKMKLLGSIKTKIQNDKTGKNVPHLEISDVLLIPCNLINNKILIINKIQESYMHLFLINHLVNYYNHGQNI